ncbi:MAG: hypothetical protein WBM44_09460 [Waterburya sp.]
MPPGIQTIFLGGLPSGLDGGEDFDFIGDRDIVMLIMLCGIELPNY